MYILTIYSNIVNQNVAAYVSVNFKFLIDPEKAVVNEVFGDCLPAPPHIPVSKVI